ncbi:DUF4440 domain-containing protein [Botrimarina sp.]|uniref:YybH family protein n=1 Tax=Botrimarina sp. TaxID=2795802 RepID=UPI0032EB2E42
MLRYRGLTTAALAVAVTLAGSATAPADDRLGANATQEEAVRQAGKAYVEALQRGDAESLTSLWTADGTYTDTTGRSFNARELIEQQFGDSGAAKPTAPEAFDYDSAIRHVTPDVTIEEGAWVDPHADGDASRRYVAVWKKAQSGWLLDSLREFISGSDQPGSPLEELDWMTGVWLGEAENTRIVCRGDWDDHRAFILRRFTVEQDGKQVMEATQRIGWDPVSRVIRSWVFHSDGSVVEGRWHNAGGDRWIVKTSGALPDGRVLSAVKYWVREGEDRCVLMSTHAAIGDQESPDSAVEFRRLSATGG